MNRTIPSLAAASLFTFAAVAAAQATGTAHPEALDDSITTSAPAQPSAEHYHKPSAAVPAPEPATAAPVQAVPAPAPALHTHTDTNHILADDSPTPAPNEIPTGTLLHVSLDTPLTTATARVGDHFSAHLTQDITRDGRVLIPAGSIIRGRVTEVHASRHFLADASLRLQPDTLTMPDGIPYPLAAQLVDFDHTSDARYESRITSEGVIVTNPHAKGRLAAAGLTTGGATAAGAMIGGGVGAAVGATIGVGANAVMWAKQDHDQNLARGTGLILDIDQPLLLNPAPINAIVSTNRTGNE